MTAPKIEAFTAERLQQSAQLSVDRMPVLQSAMERVAAACGEAMRSYSAAQAQVFLNQVENGSSWDVLEAYDDSIAVIFHVRAWSARVLIGLDRRFVYTLMEALFGGDMSEPPYVAVRPFTVLEARVARQIAEEAARALEAAFAPVSEMTMEVERVETSVDFTTLGQTNFPVLSAQLLFQLHESGGRMFVIIPQAALGPVRKRLETERSASVQGLADEDWMASMRRRVARADMPMVATLEAEPATLAALADAAPGTVLTFPGSGFGKVFLESGDQRLFRCALGQSGGYLTLILEDEVSASDALAAALAAEDVEPFGGD
ncbi:MAG: hypothetical protein NW215_14870 [Hyphomicrobiales bacterium]|nr:hypothetical protein [Hyphomicrobiales bacterium]